MHLTPRMPVSRRMRLFLEIVWALIIVKCAVVWWAAGHWAVPFHPLWVVAPTLGFAGLATALYIWRSDD